MKPRLQPLASLFFRWGRYFGMESDEVARILSEAGLIVLIGKEHWSETRREKKLDFNEYELLVRKALEKSDL